VIAPIVPKLAAKFGGRQVIGVGFAVTTAGFAAIGFVQPSWRYVAFLLPLIAIAVGMGMSNGPASSAATASVSAEEVGAGIRRIEHGPLRRRRRGDRAGSNDLRHGDG
jgi:MFS family permease